MATEQKFASGEQLAEIMALSRVAAVHTSKTPDRIQATAAIVNKPTNEIDFFVDRDRKFERVICSLGAVAVPALHPLDLPREVWLVDQQWHRDDVVTLRRNVRMDMERYGQYRTLCANDPVSVCTNNTLMNIYGFLGQGLFVVRSSSICLEVQDQRITQRAAITYGPSKLDTHCMELGIPVDASHDLRLNAIQAELWAERLTTFMNYDVE